MANKMEKDNTSSTPATKGLRSQSVSQLQEVFGVDNDLSIDTLSIYQKNRQKAWFEIVRVQNIAIRFKLDTGAMVNILPRKYFQMLKNTKLVRNTFKIAAYNGTEVKSLGRVDLECHFANKSVLIEFYVLDGDGIPLLGLDGCVRLELIKRNFNGPDPVSDIGLSEDIEEEERKTKEEIELMQKYEQVFKGLGCCWKNVHLKLQKNATPVAKPPLDVPLSLIIDFKQELDRLCRLQIIEPCDKDSSQWVSNIVIKKTPNKLRIFLDSKHLNTVIQCFNNIPTFEEQISNFADKNFVSVFKVHKACYQINLDKDTKKLFTFGTEFGFYRYKKLPPGIKIAPEVLQQIDQHNFGNIEHVSFVLGHIVIATNTVEEQYRTVNYVLNRALEKKVIFSKEKFHCRKNQIKFSGHIIQDPISIDHERVQIIQELKPPKDRSELQGLLDFTDFLAGSIPILTTLSSPLREALTQDHFNWSHTLENCFQQIKWLMLRSTDLKPFDPTTSITIQCHASFSGLGACLLQDNKPVALASCRLTYEEQQYPIVEKELLAIVFACNKWHSLVYGQKIRILTDHNTLTGIIDKEYVKIPSPRLQQMKFNLEKYNFHIECVPIDQIIPADFLSKTNLPSAKLDINDLKDLNELIPTVNICNRMRESYRTSTIEDEVLRKLKEFLYKGWPKEKSKIPADLRYFWKLKEDLFLVDGMVFYTDRIVVPKALRATTLQSLHQAHLTAGIEQTKERARNSLYWPDLNKDIEKLVAHCEGCQNATAAVELFLKEESVCDGPFERICVHTLEYDHRSYLVVCDYFSRYLDIFPIKSTHTEKSNIKNLEMLFSTHGIPRQIVTTDSISFEFKTFTESLDIELIRSVDTRYKVFERYNKQFVSIATKLLELSSELKTGLWLVLLKYRNISLENSNSTPAQALMGRSTVKRH